MSDLAIRASGLGRTAGARIDAVLERPRATIVGLVGAQLLATAVFGLALATHNGWIWFQGGDQIWFVSDGWAIAHWILPPADVGIGWPILLAPITWITGATYVQALPLVVLANTLVLGPLAVLCVNAIGCRIGGRVLGLWASILWIAAPFLAIPLFVERYHERWIDQFVPQGLGLTAMADFPSMVGLLVVALLVLRAIDLSSWTDAALAGAVAGFVGLVKPPNMLVVAGVGLAFLVARRWRELLAFGVAAAPMLMTLAIYKERGIGFQPILAFEEVHVAASATGRVFVPIDRYIDFDLDHWRIQMAQLREYFWSARVFQWVPLAGLVAVARMRPAAAALLGGWLAAFVLVKGASPQASIEANTFWRLLMPAWPAYLLLLAAIPLLVPRLAVRLGARAIPPPAPALPRRPALVAAALLCLVPLALATLLPKLESTDQLVLVKEGEAELLVPVVDELRPRMAPDRRRRAPARLASGHVAGRGELPRLPGGAARRRSELSPVGRPALHADVDRRGRHAGAELDRSRTRPRGELQGRSRGELRPRRRRR